VVGCHEPNLPLYHRSAILSRENRKKVAQKYFPKFVHFFIKKLLTFWGRYAIIRMYLRESGSQAQSKKKLKKFQKKA
jgi:hypothetical protein